MASTNELAQELLSPASRESFESKNDTPRFLLPFDHALRLEIDTGSNQKVRIHEDLDITGGVQGNDPFSSLAPGGPFIGGQTTDPIFFDETSPMPRAQEDEERNSESTTLVKNMVGNNILDVGVEMSLAAGTSGVGGALTGAVLSTSTGISPTQIHLRNITGKVDDTQFRELLIKLKRLEKQAVETRRALREYNPDFAGVADPKQVAVGDTGGASAEVLKLQRLLEHQDVMVKELQGDKHSLTEEINSLRTEMEDCKRRSEQEVQKTNIKQEKIDALQADNQDLRQELEKHILNIKRITVNKNLLAETTASEIERLRRMLKETKT